MRNLTPFPLFFFKEISILRHKKGLSFLLHRKGDESNDVEKQLVIGFAKFNGK
jgi:hypothetical protein